VRRVSCKFVADDRADGGCGRVEARRRRVSQLVVGATLADTDFVRSHVMEALVEEDLDLQLAQPRREHFVVIATASCTFTFTLPFPCYFIYTALIDMHG